MIRLYIDQELRVGDRLQLPSEELHYYKSVRREKGPIELFNRSGQIGHGKVEGNFFVVEAVEANRISIWPVRVAVGLPDYSIWKDIVNQVSELGAKELIFFPARRSQAASRRKEAIGKLEKTAIESARQCGRPEPLKVRWQEWKDLLNDQETGWKFFLDERRSAQNLHSPAASRRSVLIVVGCEGGWSEEEREELILRAFTPLHFDIPILRVATACSIAAFYGLQKLSGSPVSER